MQLAEHLKSLARYNQWANRELLAAVAALPADEATKRRPGLFSSILNTLNHPLVTDRMWFSHIDGIDHGHAALNEVLHDELDALTAARTAMDQRIVDYADDQTDADLDSPVNFTLLSGATGTMSRAMVLMHMINHNTYHRGFVVETFCQIPAPLPLIDLPVYLRGASGLTASMPHLKAVEFREAG